MDGPACEASQAVQVALNIRPLITSERIQGCKDCITVVPGEPQVQIGVHTFTFDHVYGSSGTPLSVLFSECVGPLVEGLFHGYNATVLAYGQTGSGKTFTMGTGYTVGGSTEGVIPQVMKILFSKIETLSHNTEFHLRVSYIEILKEEIHDLLDPSPPATGKLDGANGSAVYGVSKVSGAVKPPIQIRETPNGGITISGITETVVNNASEMAFCLEQGSLCRATGSTNMNTNSSRSHAIFTVTLEQRRKWNVPAADSDPNVDDIQEDFLCAKLHLVDLAGSERAKRTGADGLRFKEGVHINRGLLALGNVISALGDDKKRKGGHVPYRDSKLTRLLQDSLGGNSKTVMIACVSPADSNAEETLNTLKYANRARNIQNKPVVNRDPMTGEMQRMRQQMDLLQAELLSVRTCGNSLEDVEMLKKRIAWLESCNADLRRDLESASGNLMAPSQYVVDLQLEKDCLQFKLDPEQGGRAQSEAILINDTQGIDVLKKNQRRICKQDCEMQSQSVASQPVFSLSSTSPCLNASALDPHYVQEVHSTSTADDEFLVTAVDGGAYDQAKELEHTLLQDRLDRELQELNKHLEQKEAEMKTFAKSDTLLLKQHFEKKLIELEDEKRSLQRERDTLVGELETITTNSDEHTNRMQEVYQQKLKVLETQILELKKRQENHSHLLRQKQRSDEAAKRLQDEIQRIKSQKVQLQHKIKLEAEQFRFWKASREKEVLQLRKEGRRTEYEMHKLQALNQRQKMVLQRKTEEAAMATRRLKELLEARKSSVRNNISYEVAVTTGNSGQGIDKGLKLWLEQELEVTVRVHEVRSAYEKQAESRVTFAKELRKLQEEEEIYQKSPDYFPERRHGDNARACASLLPPLEPSSMSPNARRARISLLESIVNSSSAALVSMASQLSEAEERERTLSGRARWQHLRTLGEAKNLLQLVFNAAASSRCQLRDKEDEMKEMREKMAEMEELFNRMNVEKQCSHTDQTLGVGSAIKIDSDVCAKIGSEDVSSGFRTFDMKQPFLESFGDLMNSGEHASLQNRVVPYSLRQGSRGLQSSEIACFLASDGLEGESDMDISDGGVSDEDWEDRTTRCTVRKNREGADKPRLRREGKSLQTDRKFRIVLKPGQSAQEAFHNQVSGCRLIRPPAGERVFSDNESKSQSGTEGRCSCTSLSGCKTRKCECKAAGGLCGPNCGCKASKCANRENLEMEADPSAVATAVQMEMAEAVATLRLDKERRRVSEQGEAFSRTDTTICELLRVRGESTRKAQRVLAVHGAALLESALREGQQEEHLLSGWRAGNECGADSPVRRTPLGDIGNKKMKPRVRSMFKHRRRLTRTSSPPAIFSGITRPDFLSETGSARAVSVHFAAKGASPTAPRSDELDMCSAVPCQHSSVQTVSSELLQAATSGGEKTSSGLLAVSENVFGSCSLVCQTGTKISAGISSPTRGELRDGEPKDTDKENRIIG